MGGALKRRPLAPRLQPAHTCVALASWAMPVLTRIIGDDSTPATRAAIAVSTQHGGREQFLAGDELAKSCLDRADGPRVDAHSPSRKRPTATLSPLIIADECN
jgi:hypothetical protein